MLPAPHSGQDTSLHSSRERVVPGIHVSASEVPASFKRFLPTVVYLFPPYQPGGRLQPPFGSPSAPSRERSGPPSLRSGGPSFLGFSCITPTRAFAVSLRYWNATVTLGVAALSLGRRETACAYL